jgi:hypothetical protein
MTTEPETPDPRPRTYSATAVENAETAIVIHELHRDNPVYGDSFEVIAELDAPAARILARQLLDAADITEGLPFVTRKLFGPTPEAEVR